MPAKRSLNPKDLSFPKILDESDNWLPLLIAKFSAKFLRISLDFSPTAIALLMWVIIIIIQW